MNDIEDYCKEVGSFKVLSKEKATVLGRRKTPKAREALVNANLRLAVMWARRFSKVTGLELEDLIQEGNIGLMIAAKRFDPKKGMFSTTATWWIRSKIRRYIAEKSDSIKGPGWLLRSIVRNWKQTAETLRQETGRAPTNAEIQDRLKLSKHHLAQVKIALSLKNLIRLDEQDENGETPNEQPDHRKEHLPGHLYTFGGRTRLNGEKEELIEATMGEIRQTLNSAPLILKHDKEIEVWERRYLRHQSQVEIGTALGVTRQRVEQIERQVLRKMRQFIKGKVGRVNEVEMERASHYLHTLPGAPKS